MNKTLKKLSRRVALSIAVTACFSPLTQAAELLTDKAAYDRMAHAVNPYGDGRSAERIVDALLNIEGLSDKKPTKFIAK